MGSQTREHKIPIVDLTKENVKPGSDSWAAACKNVRYGLEEYGCFEVLYDLPIQIRNSIFASAEQLFDLSDETKMKKTTEMPACCYVALNPDFPHYEAMGVDNPIDSEVAQKFTKTMWPEGNDSFCESVQSFSKPMAELYEVATRMVFDCYGVETKLHDSHMKSVYYGLRFFHYKKRQPNETNVGVITHTDKTFATILHQHDISGLQIRTKDNQFIGIEPSPSSFLFVAADALKVWSNDRVRACEHGVMLKEYKDRYSVGFYIIVNGLIHVPEEMVDEEHPLRYHEPYDHLGTIARFANENTHRYPAERQRT